MVVALVFNRSTGERQRQEDLCEFEASLMYRVSSKTAEATQRNIVSKSKTKQANKKASKQTFNLWLMVPGG